MSDEDFQEEPVTPQPEKTPMELDNDLIQHAIGITDKALGLSRDNNFCQVSLDYTQLELIKRTLSAGLKRGNQILELVNLLNTRRTVAETSIDSIKTTLDHLKEMIPKVNIK